MAVNSKDKGNSYESAVAKALSVRFADLLGLEVGFRRATDSGSYFGGTNASRMQTHDLDYATYGDIVCPRNFKFTLECKFYKTPPSFDMLVKGNIKVWDTWIEQADSDAKKDNKMPLIVIKYNRTADLVLVDSNVKCKGITSFATYKGKAAYSLPDILSLGDEFFFDL